MELGNWPIKVQLGSTNSKGLPVLFQGSHQGLLLNNQLHYSLSQREPRACPWFLALDPIRLSLSADASGLAPSTRVHQEVNSPSPAIKSSLNIQLSCLLSIIPSSPNQTKPKPNLTLHNTSSLGQECLSETGALPR